MPTGAAVHRIDELHVDALVRIALLVAQAVERLAHVGAAIVNHGIGILAPAALMGHEGRLEAAMAVEAAGVAVGVHRLLDLGVALGAVAAEVHVDPGAVQNLHQRPVQHVDPDHRRARIIAVVVPGPVRGDDQVAADGFATLALHIGVAAPLRQDGAAGIGAVDMRGRDVAGRVDRDRGQRIVVVTCRRPPRPGLVKRMLWRSANSIGDTSARWRSRSMRSRNGPIVLPAPGQGSVLI